MQGYPQHFIRLPRKFVGIHLHYWVESGTVRGKCFAITWLGLEVGPIDPGVQCTHHYHIAFPIK